MGAAPAHAARGPQRWGGRRRHIGIALLAVAVATSGTVGALGAPDVAAQQLRNGEAEASADTFTVNIKAANANIGFTYGRTLVNYRDTTGTAEARALDLGVLPTLFGVERCDGSPPTLNVATLPEVARVDSTEPGADRPRRSQAFVPGLGNDPAGPVAGWQDASATPLPSARGVTESVDTDVFILALRGGSTEATAKFENGVREARAVSTAEELRVFGGLFSFHQPRWEATARSGASTLTHGSFTFQSATVLGIPRSPDQALRDFDGFRRGLEDLLRPLGVTLRMPEIIIDEGRVRVTPMEFKVEDMPWGAQVIAPFLGDIQPLREVLTQQLLEEDCKNDEGLLVLDVILSVLGGGGAVEISAGGVDVFTADTDFSSPPLEPMPLDAAGPPVEVAAAPELAPLPEMTFDDFSAGDLTFDSFGSDLVVETDLGLGDVATEVVATSTAPTRQDEEVAAATGVSSRFEPVGSGTVAVVVGVVGLLGALALSFGDRLLARRSARRIP